MKKTQTTKKADEVKVSTQVDKPERSHKRTCHFCDSKTLPDYKNYKELEVFVTERSRIVQRTRSGVCSKHQRILARQVKRARHLALLPFSIRV